MAKILNIESYELEEIEKKGFRTLKNDFFKFFFAILIFEAKIQILRDGGTPVDEIDSDLAYPNRHVRP